MDLCKMVYKQIKKKIWGFGVFVVEEREVHKEGDFFFFLFCALCGFLHPKSLQKTKVYKRQNFTKDKSPQKKKVHKTQNFTKHKTSQTQNFTNTKLHKHKTLQIPILTL